MLTRGWIPRREQLSPGHGSGSVGATACGLDVPRHVPCNGGDAEAGGELSYPAFPKACAALAQGDLGVERGYL